MGGEGLYLGLGKTLTPQAFGLGPPSPAKGGRGEQAAGRLRRKFLNVDTPWVPAFAGKHDGP